MNSLIPFSLNNVSRLYFIFILALSIIVLIAALVIEYLGFKPCPLCIYARYPYIIMAISTILPLYLQKYDKQVLWFLILLQLVSVSLAAYHSSIELGWLAPLDTCSQKVDYANLSIEELKNSISDDLPDCSKPALLLFGLSMAQWNFVLNLALILINIMVLRCPNRILNQNKTI